MNYATKQSKFYDEIKAELDSVLVRFNTQPNLTANVEAQDTSLVHNENGLFYMVNDHEFARQFYRHINSSVETVLSFSGVSGNALKVWI